MDELRPTHIATAEPIRQIAAGQPAGVLSIWFVTSSSRTEITGISPHVSTR